MSSPGYVWQRLHLAITCLCSEGTFTKRLENAAEAVIPLKEEDLDKGELREDLKYVLKWTSENMLEGVIQKQPDELERNQLIEKMIHILLETKP